MQALGPDDPKTVGGYELTARLGEGGMGRVYQGRSPGGRLVAVKLARPELAADPGFRSRFRSEVEAARRVGGFHTAQVVDAAPDADPPWMVTAYVPGRTLDTVIVEDGPMDRTALRALGAALSEALLAIHRCDLVHRDLKPSNIIMSDDGPRVLDFGIARALNETRLTNTNMVVGTPGFLAPEQIAGGTIGPACDVFALGTVLVHAAGGRAFGEGSLMGLMYRAVHDDPDLAAVPGVLRPLIAECLAKDPDARPTAAQLLKALAPVAGGPDSHGTPHASPEVVAATVAAVEPAAAVTVPFARTRTGSPTQEATTHGTPLHAVTFGVPWPPRLLTLLLFTVLSSLPLLPLALALHSSHGGLAWAALSPALVILLYGAVRILMYARSIRLDTTGVTISSVRMVGRPKRNRVPWDDIAALDATVGDGPVATLRLALFDNAPLPPGAVQDPVLGPTLSVALPHHIVGAEPAGALPRAAASNPRAVVRTVLDAVRHFAPEALPDAATAGDPAVSLQDEAKGIPASLEFTRPISRRVAGGVGWLLLTAICGWVAYLVWSGGPENIAELAFALASSVAAFACIGRIVNGPAAFRYMVAFDAEGISVYRGAAASTDARTQTIPWRDVSSLSRTDGAEGFSFGIQVLLKQGMPLPFPQSGLAPQEPDRVRITVPLPPELSAEFQRRRIAAVVHRFAPDVRTDHL